ncbi:hypothetical protein LX32DRAFT_42920 [Colletotrichum zoysiae]|uniref:Uncharacterized protein n=1 Tax=Colletotrichum zoysiae TaxID=1216348 RepID=A0AAD9HRT1_9PEZI|nr:hypothetical protein LX32DRAFT_42920 [Colletotrichum zoysiae]
MGYVLPRLAGIYGYWAYMQERATIDAATELPTEHEGNVHVLVCSTSIQAREISKIQPVAYEHVMFTGTSNEPLQQAHHAPHLFPWNKANHFPMERPRATGSGSFNRAVESKLPKDHLVPERPKSSLVFPCMLARSASEAFFFRCSVRAIAATTISRRTPTTMATATVAELYPDGPALLGCVASGSGEAGWRGQAGILRV